MAINMMCMNDKCKHYWEDNCMRNINEERIVIDENGKCETFEQGINEIYTKEEFINLNMIKYKYIIDYIESIKNNDDFIKAYLVKQDENSCELLLFITNAIFKNRKKYLDSFIRNVKDINYHNEITIFDKKNLEDVETFFNQEDLIYMSVKE